MTAPDLLDNGILDIFVAGMPKPQGSMRGIPLKGRVVMVANNHEDLAVWRHAVTSSAADAWDGRPLLDEAVGVRLIFGLPRPKSAPRKRVHPDRLPDLDKLARAVLDALTGVVLADDARVVSMYAAKSYVVDKPAGCSILVAPMPPDPGRWPEPVQ